LATAKQKYERREGFYNELLQKQEKAERLISRLRLAVFTAGIGTAVVLYKAENSLFYASLVAFAVMFIYLVIRHGRLKDRMKYTALLRDINTCSLKRLIGEWNTFTDDGGDFKDDRHAYSSDLDIFGKNSLFQWINTANTFIGRQKLRELLSGVVGKRNDICERQEAVIELAGMLSWRQRFLAEGMIASGKRHDPQDLVNWVSESSEFYTKPWVISIIRICPVITVILVLTGFVMNIIPWYWPAVALVIQFAFLFIKSKERHRLFSIAENFANDLKSYYKMLRLFEEHNFKSLYIQKIKDQISNKMGLTAFKQLERLSSIIDSISNRRNAFYLIFNILTLWDFQNIIALERWKRSSGRFIKKMARGHWQC
jgi:hypothetical protein